MPKKYRLSRADFIALPRANSRRLHGAYFSLTVTPLSPESGVKTACVVSKKTAARAADRNKIERRCRESLRPILARINTPAALIFYGKREAVQASFGDIQKDINALLERSGLRDTMPTTCSQ
jgi:ribonuclease P protein component